MFSNFTETTSIRINGVDPQSGSRHDAAAARPHDRGQQGKRRLLKRGEILIPELLARGMKVKVGDTVVLVATNRDGSVNGKTFTVRAMLGERYRARAAATATSTSTTRASCCA